MIEIEIPADSKIYQRHETIEVGKQRIRVMNYIGTDNPDVIILEGYAI